jgi:hypothetical protein
LLKLLKKNEYMGTLTEDWLQALIKEMYEGATLRT